MTSQVLEPVIKFLSRILQNLSGGSVALRKNLRRVKLCRKKPEISHEYMKG